MVIIFKDVGQGDSIIIEWLDSHELKIGIIDCNRKTDSNPIIEYLKTKTNYTIAFVLLSHPHSDHFSGMLELLQYLQKQEVLIHYFLHTCVSQKDYLNYSVRGLNDKAILRKIFVLASEMNQKGGILNYGFVNNLTTEINLEGNLKLKVIAPTDTQYSKYNKSAFKNNSLLNNNPDANHLSTVLKLYNDEWFALFTSDATYDVFWKLNRDGLKFGQNKFLFGQIPHHGSKDNYYPTFWESIVHDNNTIAAISVGENSYGHPSQDVLDKLVSNRYKLRLTNVNRIADSILTDDISNSLDILSERINNPLTVEHSTDIKFDIVKNKLEEIN